MFFGLGCVGRQSVAAKAGRPSLDLSFMTAGTLDPRITFTRASVGTYFDVAGALQTATSGTPRWDYDPVTHVLRGLLIEPARTNYVFQSGAMSVAPWTSIATTLTGSAAVAPDGTTTAARLQEDSTTAGHYVTQTVAGIAVNAPITASVYLHDNTRRYARFFVYDSTTVANTAMTDIDLTAGTVSAPTLAGAATAGSSTIQNVGGGWYRVTITVTLSATATTGMLFRVFLQATLGGGNYTGNGSSNIYVWGAQLENGGFPTSYITTFGATQGRGVEIATMPIGAWYNAAAGSMMTESSYSAISPAATTRIAQFDDNTAANNIIHIVAGTNGRQYAVSTVASATKMNLGNNSTYVAGAVIKMASSWQPDTQLFNLNGIQPQNSAVVGAIPGSIAMMRFGVDQTGGCAGNIYMRWVRYWPRVLAAAELQQVTA